MDSFVKIEFHQESQIYFTSLILIFHIYKLHCSNLIIRSKLRLNHYFGTYQTISIIFFIKISFFRQLFSEINHYKPQLQRSQFRKISQSPNQRVTHSLCAISPKNSSTGEFSLIKSPVMVRVRVGVEVRFKVRFRVRVRNRDRVKQGQGQGQDQV